MEIKPRTQNALLLSVGALEFLTLQLINGTVKFSVNNGAGIETVIYDPTQKNLLCDGHWHQIKVNILFMFFVKLLNCLLIDDKEKKFINFKCRWKV